MKNFDRGSANGLPLSGRAKIKYPYVLMTWKDRTGFNDRTPNR